MIQMESKKFYLYVAYIGLSFEALKARINYIIHQQTKNKNEKVKTYYNYCRVDLHF